MLVRSGFIGRWNNLVGETDGADNKRETKEGRADEKMKSGKTTQRREEKSNYSLCFTCHRRCERALIFYPCLQVTNGGARTYTRMYGCITKPQPSVHVQPRTCFCRHAAERSQ